MNACIRVKTDDKGRMSVTELKNAISAAKRQGRTPLMVIGTAGTPVLGAIDPLDAIAKVARENKMWFHVDGQVAGGYFLSKNLAGKLKGIER